MQVSEGEVIMNEKELKHCPFYEGESMEKVVYCDGMVPGCTLICLTQRLLFDKALRKTETHSTSTRENTALLPCPFCGAVASLNDAWPHRVYCTVCGAKVQSTKFDEEGEAEAVEKWNNRSEPKE